MKPSRAVVLAMAFLAGTTLSSCTQDNRDLPTLGGSPTSVASADLEAIAKTYYDCMMDAGISMDLEPNGSGQLAVVHFIKYGYAMWRESEDIGVSAYSSDQDPAAVQKVANDFFSKPYTGPALIIDGIDHSDEYAKCLSQSGYTEQAAQGQQPQRDPVLMQQQMASNNKWAACARENGWPDIKDSVMPDEDDAIWSPVVYLPVTITEDQLRQLLEACPNFDPDKAALKQQWDKDNPTATNYPDNWEPDPNITFDLTSVEDQADGDQVTRLNDILNEKMNEYNEQHGG